MQKILVSNEITTATNSIFSFSWHTRDNFQFSLNYTEELNLKKKEHWQQQTRMSEWFWRVRWAENGHTEPKTEQTAVKKVSKLIPPALTIDIIFNKLLANICHFRFLPESHPPHPQTIFWGRQIFQLSCHSFSYACISWAAEREFSKFYLLFSSVIDDD